RKEAEEKAAAETKALTLARAETERAETQLQRAEWLVYAGKLARAQTEFDFGDPFLGASVLDECRWDLRSWEHGYHPIHGHSRGTGEQASRGGIRGFGLIEQAFGGKMRAVVFDGSSGVFGGLARRGLLELQQVDLSGALPEKGGK